MSRNCRFCSAPLMRTFVDLGDMPLANAYPCSAEGAAFETRYPLHARVCDACLLVQVDDVVTPETLFSSYAYFSSVSSTWLEHARRFAMETVDRLQLGPDSLVIEVASNDGYLLRHFRSAGVPVLGIDPATNVAAEALALGIPTEVSFFGTATAASLVERGQVADLVVANNVFAHVPALNDFTAGLSKVLKRSGVLSIEVPHLLNLIERVEFDTIYHEHFSYFSLLTAERVLAAHGLIVFDVEELSTHGGSLRIWGCHADVARAPTDRLQILRQREATAGISGLALYEGFAFQVECCRQSLQAFLRRAAGAHETVVAYGAAAKGNTLLNFCAVGTDHIAFIVDRSPHKQGKFLPGSHLLICDPERVREVKPDYVLILPWNLRDEICEQMSYIRSWGGRFVIPVPQVEVVV